MERDKVRCMKVDRNSSWRCKIRSGVKVRSEAISKKNLYINCMERRKVKLPIEECLFKFNKISSYSESTNMDRSPSFQSSQNLWC